MTFTILRPSFGIGPELDSIPGFKTRYMANKFIEKNLWENCKVIKTAPQVEAVEVSQVEAVEAPQVEAVSFGEKVVTAMLEYETGLGLIPVTVEAPQVEAVEVSQVEAVEVSQVEAVEAVETVTAPQVKKAVEVYSSNPVSRDFCGPIWKQFENNPVSVNFYGPKIYGKVIFDRLNTGLFVTVVTSSKKEISFRSFETLSEANKFAENFEAPQVEAVEVLLPFRKRFKIEAPQVEAVVTAPQEMTGNEFIVTVEAVEEKIETGNVTFTIFGVNLNKRIELTCSKLEAIKKVFELQAKNPGFVYGLFDNGKQKNIHIVKSANLK